MSVLGRKRTFAESNDNDQKQQAPTQGNIPTQGKLNSNEFKHHLQVYYAHLFPYQDMFNWLSYFNEDKIFRNREFSFTLKDDIYVRYKSFPSMDSFKQDLKRLCPFKIDIGAIYNIEPCRRHQVSADAFIPEQKELVFDIDISDYDDVRSCCAGAGICNECWPLMSCAIKVMDVALRKDFGFKHLLWVFSGRRGIHCWVGDALPRSFGVPHRSAIIDYLKVYVGNAHSAIKVDLRLSNNTCIHESLIRAYNICIEYFINCSLKSQKIVDSSEGIDMFCQLIRDENVRKQCQNMLNQEIVNTDYAEKWKKIQEIFNQNIRKIKNTKKNNNNTDKETHNPSVTQRKLSIQANLMEVVFSYVYPRLDVEVTRHVNHLLKSPFCVHPKTGKVCTIIDPLICDQFDPLNQPTLTTLQTEYNNAAANNENASKIGWRDTSLKQVVKTFRSTFLDGLKEEAMTKRKIQNQNKMEL